MLKDAILKVKVLDERVRRSTVKLENDLTVSIPNCLLHFKKKAVIPEYMGKWLESAKREGYNIRFKYPCTLGRNTIPKNVKEVELCDI